MIFPQVEYVDEQQEALSAKQHGAEWARTAELWVLRRLLWMDKVWRGNVLEDLYPRLFAYAVNPDHAKDAESARQLWQEMTGFPIDGWDQIEILLAFLDGALPVARQRVGDLAIEPAAFEKQVRYSVLVFEEGWDRGREWATNRADASELGYLRVFRRAFQYESGPVYYVTEYGPTMLVRSWVFMIRPKDVPARYREIWLQMIGTQVSDPWDFDFIHGFVMGALQAVSQPEPYSGSKRQGSTSR
jgi:hypothetical protein